MVFYLVVVMSLLVLHTVSLYVRFDHEIIKWVYFVVLLCFATFRSVFATADSVYYYSLANYSREFNDLFYSFGSHNFEIANRFIPIVINQFVSYYYTPVIVFFVYAALALYLKLKFINKYSPFVYLSLLYYVIYTFSYQEMVVIRNGVAVGMFFWSIPDIVNKKPISYYCKIFVACLFHSAALIYVPLYFFNTNNISKNYRYVLLFAYILGAIGGGVVERVMPLLASIDRINAYVSGEMATIFINPRSPMELVPLLFAYLALKHDYFCINKDKMFVVVSKIFYMGLVIRYLLMPISATASLRVGDTLLAINCMFYAYLYKYIDSRMCRLLIILFSLYVIFSRIRTGYIPLL